MTVAFNLLILNQSFFPGNDLLMFLIQFISAGLFNESCFTFNVYLAHNCMYDKIFFFRIN